MFRVPAAKALRHQHLNLLSQEFVPLIAKQLLNLRIDQHDFSLPIHHDHGVRSGFQKPAEFLLRSFAFRDVLANGHQAFPSPYINSFSGKVYHQMPAVLRLENDLPGADTACIPELFKHFISVARIRP